MRRKWSVLLWILLLALPTLACGLFNSGYEDTFDNADNWQVNDTSGASATVADGVFRFTVTDSQSIFWITDGNQTFGDGTWEVDVTQIAGPEDAGYGLVFREDADNDNFYLFEVSTDGYIWIGACFAGCDEITMLVGDGWVQTSDVATGLNRRHALRVESTGGDMVFFVNDVEVGRATDTSFVEGDLGMLVETFDEGGVVVEFDNLKFTPPANE